MFGSGVRRPLPAAAGVDPEIARFTAAFDQLGIDSEHDYDPVWQKCRELGVAPHLPYRRPQLWRAQFAVELHLQPYRSLRGGRSCGGEGAVPRRRHPPLPRSALRLRRRRRLGLPALRRFDRASGTAWRRRGSPGEHQPRRSSTGHCCAGMSTSTAMPTSQPSSTSATAGPREEDELTGGVPVLDDGGLRDCRGRGLGLHLRRARPLDFGWRSGRPYQRDRVRTRLPVPARINAIFSFMMSAISTCPTCASPAEGARAGRGRRRITAEDFRDFTFANAVRLWGTQVPASSTAPASPRKPRTRAATAASRRRIAQRRLQRAAVASAACRAEQAICRARRCRSASR